MGFRIPLSLECAADLRWGRSADSDLIVLASRKVDEVNDLCSTPSRNSATSWTGRKCPLSGRLTFRFSGGAAAPSAANGC